MFGVPQTHSKYLYYYYRMTAESSIFYTFTSFTTDIPNPDIFAVPGACN